MRDMAKARDQSLNLTLLAALVCCGTFCPYSGQGAHRQAVLGSGSESSPGPLQAGSRPL